MTTCSQERVGVHSFLRAGSTPRRALDPKAEATLGGYVRALRHVTQCTFRELAARANLHVLTLGEIERDARTRPITDPRAVPMSNVLLFPILCRTCLRPVEELRRDYAIPTCYACLPPPPPIPVVPLRKLKLRVVRDEGDR